MIKKIFSVLLVLMMMCSFFVSADENAGKLLLSQRFGSFAENGTSVQGIRFASGVDTRVISENGNKVLTSRAFGGIVKIVADNYSEPLEKETVFSAKIKITGEKTTGKLFNAVFSNQEIPLLSIGEDGSVKLSDGKTIGGMPYNRYVRYSVVVNWGKGLIDVWVDNKCVLDDWMMVTTSRTAPKNLSWSIQNPTEGESSLFIDDIYIYDGNRLPWQVSLPADGVNSEVLEYTPTTALPQPELLKTVEFNNNSVGGITMANFGEKGSAVAETDEDTGEGILHITSDAGQSGGCYFDMDDGTIPTTSRYVLDVRMKVNELSGGSSFPILDSKNKAGTWGDTGFTIGNGILYKRTGSVTVGTYDVGSWVRFSLAFDIDAGRVKVYTDGEYTGSCAIPDTHYPSFFRFDVKSPVGGVFDVLLDYIRIYTGDIPRDLDFFRGENSGDTVATEKIPTNSIMDPADKLDEALKGKIMFMTTNDTVYHNGVKQEYANKDDKPININGSLMISQNLLSAVTGKKVKYDTVTKKITFGDAVMTLGSVSYSLKGENKTLSVAPTMSNGVVYFPLRSIFEQIEGKVVSWDSRGLAIVADKAVEIPRYQYLKRAMEWTESDLLYRFMQFNFPKGATMREALLKNQPNKKHPRILFTPEDLDYINTKISSGDAEWATAYKNAIIAADLRIGKDYSAYLKPGASDRQNAAVQSQAIMEDLALAYLVSGDEKYAKMGTEILDAFVNWGPLGSDAALTIGHYVATVAIGFDTFYNYLQTTDDGRKLLDKTIDAMSDNVLSLHIKGYSGDMSGAMHYLTITDNFMGVAGGGMMTLLCSIGDEEKIAPQVEYLLENIFRSLTIYTSIWAPDGAWYEGMTYTNYGIGNISLAFTAMYNCFKNFYGIEKETGITKAGYGYTYLHSSHNCLAFSDSGSGYMAGNSVREKWGYYFDDPICAQMGRQQKGVASLAYDIESLFYYSKVVDKYGVADVTNQPKDKYFYSIESATFTSSHQVEGATFAGFHAGPTGVAHDMLDMGTFTFDADNVHWTSDLGPDSYNLYNYFGTYKYYRKRTEGENCLVINPKNLYDENGEEYHGQVVGAQAYIKKMDMNKPRGAFVAMDLTEGYARDAEEYTRGYYFGDNRNTFMVQDELTLKAESELYWFMHTSHKIEILSNNKVKFTTYAGKEMICDIYCNTPGYELKVMDAAPLPESPQDASQNKNVGITKLVIHIPSASGKVNIAVKMSPSTGEYEYTALNFTPIDNWSVPDGEAPQKASLSSISINGEKYEGAVGGMKTVTIEFPFGTNETPYVEAVAERGEIISITQPDSAFGEAVIVLDGENVIKQTVVIDFMVSSDREVFIKEDIKDIIPLEGAKGTLIMPVNSNGQSIPQSNNGPTNVLDDDITTGYAQEGEGVWYEIDLGQVMDIKGVATSFHEGNTRYQYYEVMYSEDGVNFTKVWKGSSLGTTTGYESIPIPGKVRYIRLIGNKNSTSAWNNITEMRAYQ